MRIISRIAVDLYHIIPDTPDLDHRFLSLKHNIYKNIIESIPFSEPELLKTGWYWQKLANYVNDSITKEDYNNIQWCKQFIDIFQDGNYKKDDPEYHYNDDN